MPPIPKSEQTRQKILDTALALFRDRGFEETSMRQIASEAGTALGGAYYYFDSKEALVMAFYARAQEEMAPLIREALSRSRSLESRLRAIIQTKLDYFGPNRKFLGALNRHAADPSHPLSPFSEETREIREQDVSFFAEALEAARTVPADLKPVLPRMLWAYQMGLILFWIYDRSAGQARTSKLLDASLPLVTALIGLAGLPLTKPLRRRVLSVVEILSEGH